MTHRISDERLHELWEMERMIGLGKGHEDMASSLRELQQSRALISKLRELADEMRSEDTGWLTMYAGKLDSLLSAHGAQG